MVKRTISTPIAVRQLVLQIGSVQYKSVAYSGLLNISGQKPVHQDSIEEPSSAVEDAANGSNKGEKMVVGDETLPKSFVKARHRLGDQDGTKPEQNILGFFYLMRTFYGFLDWVRKGF